MECDDEESVSTLTGSSIHTTRRLFGLRPVEVTVLLLRLLSVRVAAAPSEVLFTSNHICCKSKPTDPKWYNHVTVLQTDGVNEVLMRLTSPSHGENRPVPPTVTQWNKRFGNHPET